MYISSAVGLGGGRETTLITLKLAVRGGQEPHSVELSVFTGMVPSDKKLICGRRLATDITDNSSFSLCAHTVRMLCDIYIYNHSRCLFKRGENN